MKSIRYAAGLDSRAEGAAPGAPGTLVAHTKARVLGAVHAVWTFLQQVSEVRVRDDMRRVADRVATTRPELAALLRQAARKGWTC